MLKKMLFVSALVIAMMVPWEQVAEARILGGGCRRCASLCADTFMKGMGNCDKDDSCCLLELDIYVQEADIWCCNYGDQCGGIGVAFSDNQVDLLAQDWIGSEDLSGRGQVTSEIRWSDCVIWDSLFCPRDAGGNSQLVQGCYSLSDGSRYLGCDDPTTTPWPADCGQCPDGYAPYYYCPTGAEPYNYDGVECQNDNWSPEPPPCDPQLHPLGDLNNEGYVNIKRMTVFYREWKNGTYEVGPPPICTYPNCPSDSLIREYWLSENEIDYDYDPAADQEIPCEADCNNGIDDDGDTFIDCDDSPDCDNDPICVSECFLVGEACSANNECCSNKCAGSKCK